MEEKIFTDKDGMVTKKIPNDNRIEIRIFTDIRQSTVDNTLMTEAAFDKYVDELFYGIMKVGDSLYVRVDDEGNAKLGYTRKFPNGRNRTVKLLGVTNCLSFGSKSSGKGQTAFIDLINLYYTFTDNEEENEETKLMLLIIAGSKKAAREYLAKQDIIIGDDENPYDYIKELEVLIPRIK